MTWLMFGEGDMYVDETKNQNNAGDGQSADLFSSSLSIDADGGSEQNASYSQSVDYAGGVPGPGIIREVVKYVDKPQRKITEIRIFFDDGRFETFPGR